MKLRQNGTVSFSIRLAARGQRRRSYETTPKWHCFLLIKLAAFQASGWAETRNLNTDLIAAESLHWVIVPDFDDDYNKTNFDQLTN